MGMVFKVIKELAQVTRQQKPSPGSKHFQAIQSGAGIVSDSVWDDVTRLEGDFNWLSLPPTKEEIHEP